MRIAAISGGSRPGCQRSRGACVTRANKIKMASRAATQLALAVDCPPNQPTLAAVVIIARTRPEGKFCHFASTRPNVGESDHNMCKRLNILAQHSPTCYVAQCEHGTVHLCGENISIHLQVNDFLSLTDTISTVRVNQSDANGKLRLGIGRVTLELLPDDYRPLGDLMEQAAMQLSVAAVPVLEYGAQSFLFNTKQCLN